MGNDMKFYTLPVVNLNSGCLNSFAFGDKVWKVGKNGIVTGVYESPYCSMYL